MLFIPAELKLVAYFEYEITNIKKIYKNIYVLLIALFKLLFYYDVTLLLLLTAFWKLYTENIKSSYPEAF